MTAFFQSLGMSYEWAWGLATLAGILLIALPLMLSVAMIIYAERKLWAAFALRRGPNVVGPFGVLQSFADGLKVFLQETIIPSAANRGLFLIAPIITFTVALMAWAVIPFNSGAVLANINVGLLYILAISSLGVYGIIIAGWASNSKYPFYSAIRAASQMISYEVSIGFILICVVLWAGTFNMVGIVEAQKGHVLGSINAFGLNPLLFPMAVMFLISAMAETARAPFDLTEAESELVAGYQTEYSSMSFALYWLGEYANVLLMCTLNAVLFWGGYLPPLNIDLIPWFDIPGWIWLFAKIWVFFFIFAWVKATVPRYRYDQLMRLGWKVFLPISLFWVCLVSGYLMWKGHWDSNTASQEVVELPTSHLHRCQVPSRYVGSKNKQNDINYIYIKSQYITEQSENWQISEDEKSFVTASTFVPKVSLGNGEVGLAWKVKPDLEVRMLVGFSDIPEEKGVGIWLEPDRQLGNATDSFPCEIVSSNGSVPT
jgi:NADH-quinone oxidoreductase subunit H